MAYPEILLIALCFLFVCYAKRWILTRNRSCLPTNWPIIGMLPGALQNIHQIHNYLTEILKESGGTFKFVGPWFANMDMLITSDPANIQHILVKDFPNFPKGPEFNKIFNILGDGIFNADSESWESQRKSAMSLLNHRRYLKYVSRISWDKVEKGLIPSLDHVSVLGKSVDLQDLFERYTFDTVSILIFGQDPASLSIELPHNACEKAFGDAEEAVLYRHVLPESFWRLQRWLQVGQEKKLSKAWETLDRYMDQCISKKYQELRSKTTTQMMEDQEEAFDIISAYMKINYDGKNYACGGGGGSTNFEKSLRDNLLNLMFAGRDTTSSALTWLFWLLATNPSVQKKIRQEIITNLHPKQDYGTLLLPGNFSDTEELKKLVYLHGAICEALRLFPPVPLNHKCSIHPDILPSGPRIGANTRMVLSFYTMGRMETIWGKDCSEFKPERWVTEQGGIKYEPSFKFTAFNTGPRTCLGKDMSFIQMKIVAASIIHNYQIEVVEGHLVSPSNSVVLHMKDGLKVWVTKRSV